MEKGNCFLSFNEFEEEFAKLKNEFRIKRSCTVEASNRLIAGEMKYAPCLVYKMIYYECKHLGRPEEIKFKEALSENESCPAFIKVQADLKGSFLQIKDINLHHTCILNSEYKRKRQSSCPPIITKDNLEQAENEKDVKPNLKELNKQIKQQLVQQQQRRFSCSAIDTPDVSEIEPDLTPLDTLPFEVNDTMKYIVKDQTFRSFEEFEQTFKPIRFNYSVKRSRTIESANRFIVGERKFPEFLKFQTIRYECKHYGESRKSGKGIRSNRNSFKIGCPAFIFIKAYLDGPYLKIKDINTKHNHNFVPNMRLRTEDLYAVSTDSEQTDAGAIPHKRQRSRRLAMKNKKRIVNESSIATKKEREENDFQVPGVIKPGKWYPDFKSLEEDLFLYQQRTNTVFVKNKTITVERANKFLRERKYHACLKYQRILYRCKHGGKRRVDSRGIRVRQSSYKLECPALITLSANLLKQQLIVKSVIENHNHECREDEIILYPERRRLSEHERARVEVMLQLNYSSDDIKELVKKEFFKEITKQDIVNIRYNIRKKEMKNRNIKTVELSERDKMAHATVVTNELVKVMCNFKTEEYLNKLNMLTDLLNSWTALVPPEPLELSNDSLDEFERLSFSSPPSMVVHSPVVKVNDSPVKARGRPRKRVGVGVTVKKENVKKQKVFHENIDGGEIEVLDEEWQYEYLDSPESEDDQPEIETLDDAYYIDDEWLPAFSLVRHV